MDLTVSERIAAGRDDFLLVEIERFQGPLDLLLHLIRTQDIEIFDIPIAKITDQFLHAIRGLEATNLDGAGEFLEMAATLIHIKSQMLLPRPSEEEDEDPRAELVRRLLEYEQIREITSRLRTAEADRSRRFGKGYVPPRPRKTPRDVPLETTWEEVFEVAMEVEMPVPRDRTHRITTRTVTMEEKAVLILDALKRTTRVEFARLLEGFKGRSHGVMTFLAGLELTRKRLLFLRQTRPFAELWIYRRDDAGEEGDDTDSGHLEDETGESRGTETGAPVDGEAAADRTAPDPDESRGVDG